MKELEFEVSRLSEANTKAKSLRRVAARPQGELAEATVEGKHDLSAFQTRAMVDQDMLHAAGRDHTHVQLLLYAERRNCQSPKRVITDLRRTVSPHSGVVNSARVSLHSDLSPAYDTCLQSLLSVNARCIRDYGAVYHSDVKTPLRA